MSIISRISGIVEAELDRRLDSIKNVPSVVEDLSKRLKEDGYGRKGLLFDPFQDQGYAGGFFKPKGGGSGFINNMILKLVSRRDPIVSVILHIRANQVAAFCRPQANRFDTGFRIQIKDKDQTAVEAEIREIEHFIMNTGRLEERSEEDVMTFTEFGYLITSDMMTYGHASIEKVRDRSGGLHSFLPISSETIYFANPKLIDGGALKNLIQSYRDTLTPGIQNKKEYSDPIEAEDIRYLQVINGKVVEAFTADELVMAKIYPQGELDLHGYALSPVERAVQLITSHLQIENHQRMFFQHGVASRGILVIQGDVTPNQLRTLQAQWTQQVTGPQAAWRTPILAGINGIQWQPLVGTSRDMEYAAYQDHTLRSIFSVMGMDPEEAGFGYLSRGQEQRSAGESNNEFKITASRDRGLRPLLNQIESILNEHVLPAWHKDYSRKYKICFVGLDAETREEETRRLQAEVQLHTTIDEARLQAQLPTIDLGGGLILNPALLETLKTNMYKGVFMEKFMNIKGASERPDLQYIPDPFWFQWQQFQMNLMQQQAQAQQTMEQGPPERPGNEPKDPEKRKAKQKQDQHDEAVGQHLEQQSQAQAQSVAIDSFIQANPDLFKSMLKNLNKNDWDDSHVDQMRDLLVRDFERASNYLLREVTQAVKDDLTSREEANPETEGDEKKQ